MKNILLLMTIVAKLHIQSAVLQKYYNNKDDVSVQRII